jgi:thiamine pyrophosphokinase
MSKQVKQFSLREMIRNSIIKKLKKTIVKRCESFKYNIDELDTIIKNAAVMSMSELKIAKSTNLNTNNDLQIDEFYVAMIETFV